MRTFLGTTVFSILLLLTAQQASANSSNETEPWEVATACVAETHDGEDGVWPNLIAARLFGEWETANQLSPIFAPAHDGARVSVTIQPNQDALVRFDNRFGCAYASGTLSLQMWFDDRLFMAGESPFILVSQNGNPLLVVAEGLRVDGDHITNPVPGFVVLVPAPDASHDLLFLGKDVGHDFMPLARVN